MANVKKGWRLIFAPGLLDNFLSAEPCSDFRVSLPGSNHFGKDVLIEGHFRIENGPPTTGLMLRLKVLEDTGVYPFSEIPDDIIAHWGRFAHHRMPRRDAFAIMQGFYPNLGWDDLIAVNLLVLPQIAGLPIAGPLPESAKIREE